MIAGVVLDDWKLPVFKKHLDAAGYQYDEPTEFTEWVHQLQPIIEAAQRECAEMRSKVKHGQ
jgi:hypothetical protein